jgi:hypothetical protein
MKPLPPPIHAPLSSTELVVLWTLARFPGDPLAHASLEDKLVRAKATYMLRQRGFIQKVEDDRFIVTPEGLSAYLDVVGIEA